MCFVLIDEAIHMQRLSEKTHQFLGSCFPRQCRYIISAGEKKTNRRSITYYLSSNVFTKNYQNQLNYNVLSQRRFET